MINCSVFVEKPDLDRLDRACHAARTAADLLRERLGATRVIVFGALAHDDWFTRWSDIDLAAWDIPPPGPSAKSTQKIAGPTCVRPLTEKE